MGDSTCLMQTFSPSPHTSETFHEPHEGNQLRALGESVSFGRFMTEPLAWEKWSSFNHNRYLEEVEKYSKPGSVAQKKAYFEAHYKKKIAEKEAAAAAALEENGVASCNVVYSEGVDQVSASETFDAEGGNSNAGEVYNQVSIDAHHEEQVENRIANQVGLDVAVPSEKLPLQENSSVNLESVVPKIDSKPNASLKASVRASKLPISPARPTTPVNARKENNPTLNSKKATNDLADKRRSTPKSLRVSLNAPPVRDGEANKTTTPWVQKSREPKVAALLPKTPKDSSTLLKAPAEARVDRVAKLPPVTPHPYSRRTKAPLDHIKTPVNQTTRVSRKMDVKCKSLSVAPSESSAAAWAPNVSSSFSLRSEERAAKRREYFQKLQEEQNAREAQKMQLQAKSEEKAEVELKQMRQNLGFKAKPMPDFYREPQSQKTPVKKIPLTVPRSPKLGRKPSSSSCHETNPLHPRTPSAKNDTSKQAMTRTSRTRTPTPAHSAMSTPRRSAARENASPNIQR